MYPVRKEGGKKQVSSPWGAEKQLEATEKSKNKKKKKKNTELFKKPQLVNGVQCYGEVKDHKN